MHMLYVTHCATHIIDPVGSDPQKKHTHQHCVEKSSLFPPLKKKGDALEKVTPFKHVNFEYLCY